MLGDEPEELALFDRNAPVVMGMLAACEEALILSRNPESGWLAEADLMLSAASWDTTQARMAGLIAELLGTRTGANSPGRRW